VNGTLERVLADDGPIASALRSRFESRPEQVEMARAVSRTLESGGALLAEAGTGVGKSFAYLVPAILRCLERRETVVVATHTIALQEQLVEKDIPLLAATLGSTDAPGWSGELRPVLVKGRGNYLSIRRLELASARQSKLFASRESLLSLRQVEDWAYQTADGSLSSMPEPPRPEVWDQTQSDKDNCMGRRCPQYDRCFYQNARREAERANLLVCNHALFFADLALRIAGTPMLPRYHHVILDEAHMVEDVASEHLGVSLTSGRVWFLLRALYDTSRQRGYLESLRLATKGDSSISRVIELVQAVGRGAADFFDEWTHLADSGELRNGRVREPGLVSNSLGPAFRQLSLALSTLKQKAQSDEDRFELNAYAARAEAIADAAEAFCTQSLEGFAYWVEVTRRASWGGARGGMRGARVTLACAPVDVGPILQEHLFDKPHGVVLTSATLATRGLVRTPEGDVTAPDAFKHVKERLGCQDAESLQLGSPFDLETQVQVFIERTLPEPPGGGGSSGEAWKRYYNAMAERVIEHACATDGGAFVLFTSFAMLDAIAERVSGPLGRLEMPVLAQGRDGPRSQILQNFRESGRAVLLGAASFWQGVDVQGDALRNVIIARLPFEPPDRPLSEARHEMIRERGGNPFKEDSLPRAVIRFKQGVGRLIRSHTDHGRIVVLDPRIETKFYGKAFREALPETDR